MPYRRFPVPGPHGTLDATTAVLALASLIALACGLRMTIGGF